MWAARLSRAKRWLLPLRNHQLGGMARVRLTLALGIGAGKPLLGAASVLIEQIVQAGVQDVAYLDVVVAHDFPGLLVEEYGHTQLSAAIIRRVC